MTPQEAAVIKAATDLVDTHRHIGTWAYIYSDLVAAVAALRGPGQTPAEIPPGEPT